MKAPTRQCTARSKQAKRRCRRAAIPGGNVCKMHGGAAPQVELKAQQRLAALVDPALAALEDLLTRGTRAATRLGAARDVLDRNGLRPAERIELESGLQHRAHLRGMSEEELLAYKRALMEKAGIGVGERDE